MCVDVVHSHSGALSSGIDGSTALVVESTSAGVTCGLTAPAVAACLLLRLLRGLQSALRLCDGLSILLILVDGPIEDVVVLEAFTYEEVAEDLTQVGVVGLVIEAKAACVVEVDSELVGKATAKHFGWGGHLLLHNAIVLLLLRGRFETLPRQATAAEVQHHVAERLHVITARLLCKSLVAGQSECNPTGLTNAQVGIDGCIACGSRQVLVLAVRDVEVRLRVAVLLRQSEIDHVHLIASLPDAHQEVVRLDVAVDERLGVNVFDA